MLVKSYDSSVFTSLIRYYYYPVMFFLTIRGCRCTLRTRRGSEGKEAPRIHQKPVSCPLS